ncbi:MAG: hypothetical protein V1775_13895 [Bacteroidota bacterium]
MIQRSALEYFTPVSLAGINCLVQLLADLTNSLPKHEIGPTEANHHRKDKLSIPATDAVSFNSS